MRCRDELSSLIDSSNSDIVVLTETWLSGKIRNSEIFNCQKQYIIYRCDREDRAGGGVLIAVADNVISSLIDISTQLECIWISLFANNKRLILGVCYRPPSMNSSFCEELHDSVNKIIMRFPNSPIVLMGDFNFPRIMWSSIPPTVQPFSSECNDFINFCSDYNLSQLVTQPTRITSSSANILDLILTTCPDLVSPILHLPGLSDHCVLHFDLNIRTSAVYNSSKCIRDYGKADFHAINRELSIFIDLFLPGLQERPVNVNWDLLKGKFEELFDMYVPLRNVLSNSGSPWFTRALGRLGNKKKRLFRAAKLCPTDKRWTAYHIAADSYKAAVSNAKLTFFTVTLPSMLTNNPQQFWKVMKGNSKTVVSLKADDGSPISRMGCADVLNEAFVSCFSVLSNTPDPECVFYDHLPMHPISVDPEGISKIIDSLKVYSSAGIDGISTKFLKNTKIYSSILLAAIFNQSIQSGALPDDWKVARVVPVHKGGDSHSPRNFRPISLTSIPCKILEHIIYSNLFNFLDSYNFFCPFQHGFRKSFSCETQLASFTNDLHTILDRRSNIDCIFLDLSKAFDKVSHKLLLLKLSKLNIDSSVLSWIHCFLTNRQQLVTVNGFSSTLVSVTSGVPQGSVLGPLLFLIYINDIASNISSKISLFADDCVVYREVTNSFDLIQLQNDINTISLWCDTWSMELNANKCKSMRISRTSQINPDYNIRGIALQSVLEYKYLGVHITFDLTWKSHIDYVTNNASRMLGYLKRNFSLAPQSLKLILYKTLVRPKLEYAHAIWDPGHSLLIASVEAIQSRSVRFIYSNYHRTSSVSLMKANLSLPDLSTRRKNARLCLFHKIYYANVTLREKLIVAPFYVSSRLDHQHKVGIPNTNTNAFYQSFIPRTSLDWNHLPATIASITDSVLFKKALDSLLT